MLEVLEAGARNLLINCADTKAGDRILIVGEDSESPYFDPQLCNDVATVANKFGAYSDIILAKPVTDASQFPTEVAKAMQTADITIFFSRLGDQVRFVDSPGTGKKIMTYTLTRQHLQSPFAGVDYRVMSKIRKQLMEDISSARRYRIESTKGTNLSGEMKRTVSSQISELVDFTLELFPVMIFPPVDCISVNGQLVIDRFLMSTSVHQYDDSLLYLDSPVTATIEDSVMIAFDGDSKVVAELRQQLERAAAITGGSAYLLNSWHTGINPHTFFDGNPYDNLEHWGTVSYGSPRYTHFHTAGIDPGDVSINLLDASISFDDKLYWDQGKFVYLDEPNIQLMLGEEGRQSLRSSTVGDIGL